LGSELSAVAAQQACPKILLDCSGLTYASSSMLGKLISLHKEVKAQGGKLTLCALTPTVKEVMSVMKLYELMDIRETVSDGLASFA
jgi:anti-anti-sigma factor